MVSYERSVMYYATYSIRSILGPVQFCRRCLNAYNVTYSYLKFEICLVSGGRVINIY